MKKEKKQKKRFVDDGHTVYSMDGLDGDRPKKEKVGLTKKERRAAVKAAFSCYLPILFLVLACFFIVMLAMHFWLGA